MEPVEAMEVEEECGDLLGDYNSNCLMDKSSSVWRRSREREEVVEESDKSTAYWRRSRGSSCGSSAASPETEEFESLERRLHSELEQKLVERERRVSDMSDRKVSDLEEPVSLQLVEKRQLRTFSRADEYLYAMKEDLAEWLNLLYPNINIDAENFMETLQTGEHLLRHANSVRRETLDLIAKIEAGELKRKLPSFSVPEADLPIRENVVPGTWFARDNVYNFIKFCRLLQVMEVVMFETEDLVSSKNEKHVVLTLLEVARRGAKIGMLAPMLVQFEQEIDQEIAREEKERKKREKEERERERQIKEEEKAKKRQAAKIAAEREAARDAAREAAREKQEAAREAARQAAIDAANAANDDIDLFPSLAVEVEDDTGLGDVEDDYPNDIDIDNVGEEGVDDVLLEEDEAEEDEEYEEEEEEEEEEEMEGYAFPIGPMPQIVSNDLRSLDEMVRDLVSECQCPSQFPMHRISEGRYKIGDTNVMIFVRILRSHVMVRVGGGWDTLQNYLDKHDPCRCRRGHRSTLGAHMNVRTSRSPMAVGVTYDRSESPGTPTRRSSTSVMSQPPRRGSSYCSPSHYAAPHSPTDKSRSFSRQWDSPRGSLSGTLPRDSSRGLNSPRGSIGGTLPRSRSPSAPFAMGSQSPASTRRMMARTPIVATAKVSKTNGPSPLLRDGLREGLEAGMSRLRNPYETPQQVPKDETGFATRSDSSLSLGKDGRRTDPLTLCDSGSEVSDEGYKSSHGNVSKTEDNQSTNTEDSAKSAESPVPERPESSLTVGSECSSTISTDDGRTNSPVDEEQGSSSPTLTSDLAPKILDETQTVLDKLDKEVADSKESSAQLSPTTKSRLANLLNKIPKLGRSKKNGSDTSPDSSDKETSPTHSAKPTNNKSPAHMYRNNSSSKISRNNSSSTFSRNNSSGTFSRNNSSTALYPENNRSPLHKNTNTTPSPMRTLPRTPSGYGILKAPVDSAPRSAGVTRSRSMSSDNGMAGLSRQGSYRAPRGTSRYMQAAQAYAARNKGNTSTWSSSATRTPSRPALATDTFQPPPKRHSRTASASPGVHRRRFVSSSNQTSPTDTHPQQITSTHSTPSKRPQNRKISPINKDPLLLGDFESDEHILKRMEEILFTYKSKVEDKLAAEGKELPKDIFEDFTSHWVNSSPHRAKSMDSLDSADKSTQDKSPNSKTVRKLPTPRQDYREGQKLTKIPLPTFYKSPIPSETHL